MGNIFRRLSSFVAIMVVVFSLVTIYRQSQSIFEKFSRNNVRDQEGTTPGTSPQTGKKQTVFFSITSLVIPVYTTHSSFRRIVMDFRMASSNNQLKAYFEEEENIHLLYDKLNSQLAPMALEFPLEEEGKRVIKDKIRREINQLVRELGMEGEIEEVYIDQMLAG